MFIFKARKWARDEAGWRLETGGWREEKAGAFCGEDRA
jgi:hypothetical protein